MRASHVASAEDWDSAVDAIALSYDARFIRRKKLIAKNGLEFLVDLPQVKSVDEGDAFALDDGGFVEILAAPEQLIEVTGHNLASLAWHIGNRHTPCQIEDDRLLIQHDHVLKEMLELHDAVCRDVMQPFRPVMGAYGHGRTHSHSHAEFDHG